MVLLSVFCLRTIETPQRISGKNGSEIDKNGIMTSRCDKTTRSIDRAYLSNWNEELLLFS